MFVIVQAKIVDSSRFAISTCTARYGRYIPVRQVTGTRTARYRAVPSKINRRQPILKEIDRRRSIEEEKGKKKRKSKKKRRGEERIPRQRRPRPPAVAARGCFFSRTRRRSVSPREETDRGDSCTGTDNMSVHRYGLSPDTGPTMFGWFRRLTQSRTVSGRVNRLTRL
ncbi:hypothetical protein GW17_00049154 [Ensete ventricosum]|nr:hypothetical protein GW17_00049154 [Ensete ventricosum]